MKNIIVKIWNYIVSWLKAIYDTFYGYESSSKNRYQDSVDDKEIK